MFRKFATVAAVAVVLMLAGCSTPTPKAKPQDLQAAGTITVPINIVAAMDGTITTDMGSPCIADDGYDDISTGAQVVITDAAGKMVGTGSLDGGKVSSTGSKCDFEFKVDGVPAGSKFYGIHIGNVSRGVIQEKAADLGNVQLTLGD